MKSIRLTIMSHTNIKKPLTAAVVFVLPMILLLMCLSSSAVAQDRPNIVIIWADDLGYGDLGVYGHPTIQTPNLDRMAHEGMKFTQFYAADPRCTMSRAALLTGRYPVRTGVSGVFFAHDSTGMSPDEITIADALKEQGYATTAIGKWHLGHLNEYLPTNQGFDSYFGIPYSNDMSYKPRRPYFPPLPLMEDEQIIEQPVDQATLTRRYTERAVSFIQQNADQPFFIYLSHTFPHVPLFASEQFHGKSSRGLYGDVVEEIDWSTGEILAELKAQGVAENTLVIFTSDNGPWLSYGEEGGSAGLLRGGKGYTWEGGMRVPGIAWWPGKIPPGQVSKAVASTIDLFTTSLTLAGADIPDDRIIDGVDLMPVLSGQTESVREEFFYYNRTKLYAVRKGPWKLHIRKPLSGYEVSEEPDPPLLYHLEFDPSEQNDLAAEHYADVIPDLLRLVEEHKSNLVIRED